MHSRSLSLHSESAHRPSSMRRRPGAATLPHDSTRNPSYTESTSLPTLSRVLSASGSGSTLKEHGSEESEERGMSTVELSPPIQQQTIFENNISKSFLARFMPLNQQIQDPLRTLSATSSPQSIAMERNRTDETLNEASTIPASAITSIDAKITAKWPQPQFVKRVEDLFWKTPARANLRLGLPAVGGGAEIGGLEEGFGLGMNSLDQWTGFKWCLLLSVVTVFTIGLAVLVLWKEADVMYVADGDILVMITLASSILLLTSLVGLSGTLLNSRPILAIYTLLLWPSLISILIVGYSSYRRYAFKLDHKLNLRWSEYFTPLGRLLVQASLRCCGYYSPLHEATPSGRCYPRTVYPGCKGPLYRFEKQNLGMIWRVTFGIVLPIHLANIFVAMLCSNHVTKTFGKGMIPRGYRLTEADLVQHKVKLEEEMNKMKVKRIREPELVCKGFSNEY